MDHQANIHKMKILTVMSLAEDSSIISFETIQQQVQINAEQVEPFLLERKFSFTYFLFMNGKLMSLNFQFLGQNLFAVAWISQQKKLTFQAPCTEHSANSVGKC